MKNYKLNRAKINGWSTNKPTSPIPATYSDLPPDQDDWSCGQWDIYWNRLKFNLGYQKAKEIWVNDFDTSLNDFPYTSDAQWCAYECDFVTKWQKESIYSGGVISDVACVVDNTTDTIKDISSIGQNTGKILYPFLLGVAGVIAYMNRDKIAKMF